jgi:hypothetical protein
MDTFEYGSYTPGDSLGHQPTWNPNGLSNMLGNCLLKQTKSDLFTLITCSYNTPFITEVMLKTYCMHHAGKHRIIIVENSDPEDTTREMLARYNIPYIDGYKILPSDPISEGYKKIDSWFHGHYRSHHAGLDWAVRNCETPYCLIVDTDILFKQNLEQWFDFFANNEQIALLGPHYEKTKDSPQVLPRVHPCFMMLDVELFKKYDDLTFNSDHATGPSHELMAEKLADDECYDVGSYLFLRIGELGKQTSNIRHNVLYHHYEGASRTSGKHHIHHFYEHNINNNLSSIDITNKYY